MDQDEPPVNATRAYRLLLRAFPPAFRARFDADMTGVFEDRLRDARRRGRIAAALFWLRTIADVITHGLAERRVARHLSHRRPPVLTSLLGDLRFAWRTFRHRPGFTAVALITLALGIGANTAIFSVVHAVLIRDLPYPDSGQLVRVYATHRKYNFLNGVMNPFDFTYVEQRSTTLASISALGFCGPTLTGAGRPTQLKCSRVMSSFFDVMGTRPALGRPFTSDDARENAPVVEISHALWRDRFGGRSDIVGQTMRLDDVPHTVIGVMPEGFDFPNAVDIWRPYALTETERADMGSWFLANIARVRSGVTVEAAHAEVVRLGAELEAAYPARRTDRGLRAVSLKEDMGSRAAQGLRLLQGVVLVVLLIACVNVANLLLAQATGRRREFGIRASIGGSRWRLIRQSLTESVALAGAGGLLGTLIAIWGVRALVALAPPFLLPDSDSIGISWPVLGVTALGTAITGLVFGLAPALLSSSSRVTNALKDDARVAAAGLSWSRRQWLRAGLVATEVALALVLLAGAGLLVRSFTTLLAQPPGFRADHVLTARIALPNARYPTVEARSAFWSRLLDELRAVPGVVRAAEADALPFTLWEFQAGFVVKGREDAPNDGAGIRTVTPEFFDTLGIPLRAGRNFSTADTLTSEPVVIVSDEFVRQHMPGLDPIGQQISVSRKTPVWATVVGVVGATRHLGLDEPMRAEFYWPLAQRPDQSMLHVAIETAGPPDSFAPAVADAVARVDADLPVLSASTMTELIGGRLAERRFYVTLLALFAGLAAVLAATGIYGVMAYLVSQGRREIGIRLALGARPGQVRANVVRQGLTVVAVGAAVGFLAARSLSSVLASQLFGITPTDPASYAGAVVALFAIAAMACWLPALRTSRVDPAIVLRTE